MLSRIPPHHGGALRAIVTTREAGMRWPLRCCATSGIDTDEEIVWSWHPDADANVATTLTRRARDGGQKAGAAGRSRIIRKAIARGMPGCLG
jgi:hypothetical protein